MLTKRRNLPKFASGITPNALPAASAL